MGDTLHLVATNEREYGWSLTSPQLPGFVYGRPNREEFDADLEEALEFAGAPDCPRVLHEVERVRTPEDVDLLIRIARDRHVLERRRTAKLLLGALQDPQQRTGPDGLTSGPRLPTGEILFVIALPSDRLGWVYDQLGDRDTIVRVAASASGGLLWVSRVALSELDLLEDAITLEQLGLSNDSTVGELMMKLGTGHAVAYA